MYLPLLALTTEAGLPVLHCLPDSLDSIPSKFDCWFAVQTVPVVAENTTIDLPLMLGWFGATLELMRGRVDVTSYSVAKTVGS